MRSVCEPCVYSGVGSCVLGVFDATGERVNEEEICLEASRTRGESTDECEQITSCIEGFISFDVRCQESGEKRGGEEEGFMIDSCVERLSTLDASCRSGEESNTQEHVHKNKKQDIIISTEDTEKCKTPENVHENKKQDIIISTEDTGQCNTPENVHENNQQEIIISTEVHDNEQQESIIISTEVHDNEQQESIIISTDEEQQESIIISTDEDQQDIIISTEDQQESIIINNEDTSDKCNSPENVHDNDQQDTTEDETITMVGWKTPTRQVILEESAQTPMASNSTGRTGARQQIEIPSFNLGASQSSGMSAVSSIGPNSFSQLNHKAWGDELPNFDVLDNGRRELLSGSEGSDDDDSSTNMYGPNEFEQESDRETEEDSIEISTIPEYSALVQASELHSPSASVSTRVIEDAVVDEEVELVNATCDKLRAFLRGKFKPVGGIKAALIDRVKEIIGDDTSFKISGVPRSTNAASVPLDTSLPPPCSYWLEYDGTDQGIEEDVTPGFNAPTNLEGRPVRRRMCFLTNESIQRPKFIRAGMGRNNRERSNGGDVSRTAGCENDIQSEKGGPCENMNLSIDAKPIDYFNLLMTEQFREKVMVGCTNMKAAMEGAGNSCSSSRKKYPDFTPFDREEIDSFLGLLLAHGFHLKPRIEYWFLSSADSLLFGNETVRKIFRRGDKRLAEFKHFFCLYDPRTDPSSTAARHPLFKVQYLISHLHKNFLNFWVPGRDLSIDEQTIGFQGRSSYKQRIKFKRVGDGFMCDALCDQGFTISFIFRHDDVPVSGHNLSATSERVIWLCKQIKSKWCHIYMDNLFNSVRLTRAGYIEGVLIHGVVRSYGRGLPSYVIQKEVKSKRGQDSVRGTVKVAVLKGDSVCPNIIAASVYDTKPVHVLSTVANHVNWRKVNKKIFSLQTQKLQDVSFHRLNLLHMYNFGMGNVDIADQLRLQYRPDRWMRNRKWWWSVFLWGLGVSVTNSYLLYKKNHEKARRSKKANIPSELTHLQFLEQLSTDLLTQSQSKSGHEEVGSVVSRSDSSSSIRPPIDYKVNDARLVSILNERATTINYKTLTHGFPLRFDGQMHPFVTSTQRKPCQLCIYNGKMLEQNMNGVQKKRLEAKLRKDNQLHLPPQKRYRNTKCVQRCVR